MKRIAFASVVLLLLTIMSACRDGGQRINDSNLQSTDLSNIYIAGLTIGSNANDIDMSMFSHTESRNELYTFWFKEIAIKSDDDGLITKILAREPRENDYYINGKNDLLTVEQIKGELGQYHNDYRYDREQGLRAITYSDKENKIRFTLVYSDYDNSLIWLILDQPC